MAQAMRKLTMVKAINLALHQEMERDDDVVVLGEDVGVDEGVFRVTEGLLKKFGDQADQRLGMAIDGNSISDMDVGRDDGVREDR